MPLVAGVAALGLGLAGLWLAGLSPRVAHAAEPDEQAGRAVFQNEVREILAHHCLKCHGGETVEAEFSLVDAESLRRGGVSGTAIEPGNPRASRLYQRVTHATQPGMPFRAAKLTDKQIDSLTRWIELGAPYDKPLTDSAATAADWTQKTIAPEARDHWAFRPLREVPVPQVRRADWARNPIDQFVLSRLEGAGLEPNPPAEPARWLRRAAFSLTGLPPTAAQLDALQAGPVDPVFARQVEEWLGSLQFGERWARHWLDLVRFAESHGYEHDYDRPTAYTYRDFVIEALQTDLPYDQFVKWQLAGDELAPHDYRALWATGYLAAGVHSTQITKNEVEKHRYDELDDIVATLGQSLLGLSVGCARCHDHKYDPIPQRDYYRMVSTFTTTVRSEVDVELDQEQTARAREQHTAAALPLRRGLAEYQQSQLPARLAAWEAEHPFQPQSFPWLVVVPEQSKSDGGTTLENQPDGAILATGANPQFDVYTFTCRTTLQGIRHLRIEALSHPSLVRGGPGRAPNGNFDLTDLKVTIAPANQPEQAVPVRLASPRATFEQPGLPAAATIDDNDRSGWAVDPQFGKDHALAFTLAEPVGFEQGSLLTFRLVFRGNDMHNFGRTRLALSTAAEPPELQAEGLSAQLASAFVTPAEKRSPDQQRVLLAWYGQTHDPEWQKQKQALDAHIAATPQPKLRKSLISSEGLPALRLHTQGGDFLEQTHFLRRGDPNQKQAVALPGFLQVLTPFGGESGPWEPQRPEGAKTSFRRVALANWLTDVEHGAGSLLARVIVNRLWQHHFGRGLVETPNDFGLRGSPPSHPELLDWLALRLVRGGWKLRPIHQLMLDSATWRQSADVDAGKLAADRDNRLLWRRQPVRLEAESIRDSVLQVAGLLDPTPFGPGTLDQASLRRSIYFTVKRSRLMAPLQVFDAPDALSSIGERPRTTVAPQALLLMNAPQTRQAARGFADRLLKGSPANLAGQVTLGHRLALARAPTDTELADGMAFVQAQAESYRQAGSGDDAPTLALADYCQVLFCLNEFIYIE